ncbi:Calcipressin-domain-containing protein [Lipomyces kononenkoae]|uniref:Calcipressin-domain-containing protein n=1 Tax=Lipomyces kononenkoae TaxID=34357 RepID=A0ACC3T485_LIPKO
MSSSSLEEGVAPLSSLLLSERPTASSSSPSEVQESISGPTPVNSSPASVPRISESNTLVFAGLSRNDDFESDRLLKMRSQVESVSSGSLIHWGPVPSFGRIFTVLKSTADALEVRMKLDGEICNSAGSRIQIYFADYTPIEPLLLKNRKGPMSEIERQRDTIHLQLPDPGRLLLISPPPSPPVGWESQLESPPNTNVGFPEEVLNAALAKLIRTEPENESEDLQSPVTLRRNLRSEFQGACGAKFDLYSDIPSCESSPRSPSVVIMPPDDSHGKPGIIVSDFCDDTHPWIGSKSGVRSKTTRPPIRA